MAAEDLQAKPTEIELVGRTRHFYVYNMKNKDKTPLRILDKKRFIRVQRNDGAVVLTNAGAYRSVVTKMWDDLATFKADTILHPDYYICVGARVMDFNGSTDLEQILMLMDVDMQMMNMTEDVIIVGARNQ